MKYMSVKEAAAQWGVTIQMVRRYCQKGMIPQVTQENGGWRIPEGTVRPGTPEPIAVEKKQSSLVTQIKAQRKKNNHYGKGEIYQETQMGCINSDCVDVADHLVASGYNPAILNLASAKKPGGGYRDGLGAQEESLCRSSNLSLSLYQFGNPKYVNIQESGVPTKKIGYPLDINFGGIYTPNVTFFRNNKTRFFTLRNRPFLCDVITVAALSFNGKSIYSGINELEYRSASGGFTPEGEAIMLNKIRTIFRMGVEHGKDALILGAFGCGAYKLPVPEVVALFRKIINEQEFENKFRLIVFAIREKKRRPNGLNGKYAAFYQEFGTYDLDKWFCVYGQYDEYVVILLLQSKSAGSYVLC